MENPVNESPLSVAQVEQIMQEWGQRSTAEFASLFGVDQAVIETVIAYLRQLKRVSDEKDVPAAACLREDSLASVVRCAGARHGYT